MTAAITVESSPAVRAICATYWRTKPRRGADHVIRQVVADNCCHGCPLSQPCGTWHPTTYEGIDAHRTAMNAAAEALGIEDRAVRHERAITATIEDCGRVLQSSRDRLAAAHEALGDAVDREQSEAASATGGAA